MQAAVLSIGDELTLGQSVDTNTAWISTALARLGVKVVEHITLGDDKPRLVACLERLCGEVDVLIATGGLGPTEDDLTRFAIAEVLGAELVLDEGWLAVMQQFFDRIGRVMVERNRIQAMIPRGCCPLYNPVGTACGIGATIRETQCYFLPGVPREMQRLCEDIVLPAVAEQAGKRGEAGQGLFTRILRCYGTGESDIGERIRDLMQRQLNPLVNCTVADSIISLRINTWGADERQVASLTEPLELELRQRLGDLVYGVDDDTLQTVVGRQLIAAGKTVAVAESCTGGDVSKLLTDVPGASKYFHGSVVTYSNDAKTEFLGVDAELIGREGAVSEAVAAAMAVGVRQRLGTDYGISTTGIAGPDGGSEEKPVGLVYMALADAGSIQVKRGIFPGTREQIRLRASLACINGLRLALASCCCS